MGVGCGLGRSGCVCQWLFHPKAPICAADVMPGKSASEPSSETGVLFGAS